MPGTDPRQLVLKKSKKALPLILKGKPGVFMVIQDAKNKSAPWLLLGAGGKLTAAISAVKALKKLADDHVSGVEMVGSVENNGGKLVFTLKSFSGMRTQARKPGQLNKELKQLKKERGMSFLGKASIQAGPDDDGATAPMPDEVAPPDDDDTAVEGEALSEEDLAEILSSVGLTSTEREEILLHVKTVNPQLDILDTALTSLERYDRQEKLPSSFRKELLKRLGSYKRELALVSEALKAPADLKAISAQDEALRSIARRLSTARRRYEEKEIEDGEVSRRIDALQLRLDGLTDRAGKLRGLLPKVEKLSESFASLYNEIRLFRNGLTPLFSRPLSPERYSELTESAEKLEKKKDRLIGRYEGFGVRLSGLDSRQSDVENMYRSVPGFLGRLKKRITTAPPTPTEPTESTETSETSEYTESSAQVQLAVFLQARFSGLWREIGNMLFEQLEEEEIKERIKERVIATLGADERQLRQDLLGTDFHETPITEMAEELVSSLGDLKDEVVFQDLETNDIEVQSSETASEDRALERNEMERILSDVLIEKKRIFRLIRDYRVDGGDTGGLRGEIVRRYYGNFEQRVRYRGIANEVSGRETDRIIAVIIAFAEDENSSDLLRRLYGAIVNATAPIDEDDFSFERNSERLALLEDPPEPTPPRRDVLEDLEDSDEDLYAEDSDEDFYEDGDLPPPPQPITTFTVEPNLSDIDDDFGLDLPEETTTTTTTTTTTEVVLPPPPRPIVTFSVEPNLSDIDDDFGLDLPEETTTTTTTTTTEVDLPPPPQPIITFTVEPNLSDILDDDGIELPEF